MQIVHRIEDVVRQRNSIATVGMFDGVHRAHQEIIRWVVQEARSRGSRSVIVTFDPHPKEVVGNRSDVELLTTLDERLEKFAELGIDIVLVVRFDASFAAISSREFAKRFLVDGIGVGEVIEGYDHHWGRNREGDVHTLEVLGEELGFAVRMLEPMKSDEQLVNSSAIRSMLREGRATEASEMLMRPYRLTGTVVRGDQRGRLLGYPTANIELPSSRKLVPRNGIYLTRVTLERKSWAGLLSIGVRPTFKTSGHRTIEVHILDFDQDIYGAVLKVDLLEHMREEQRFDSAEALILQMKQDEMNGRKKLLMYSVNSQ